MLATLGVDALISHHQTLDRHAAQKVRLDDFVHVLSSHAAIPDRIGIDHQVGSMLALVEASGFVGAKAMPKSALSQLLLECLLQCSIAFRVAAAAGTGGIALVGTDKDMFFVLGHRAILEESGAP